MQIAATGSAIDSTEKEGNKQGTRSCSLQQHDARQPNLQLLCTRYRSVKCSLLLRHRRAERIRLTLDARALDDRLPRPHEAIQTRCTHPFPLLHHPCCGYRGGNSFANSSDHPRSEQCTPQDTRATRANICVDSLCSPILEVRAGFTRQRWKELRNEAFFPLRVRDQSFVRNDEGRGNSTHRALVTFALGKQKQSRGKNMKQARGLET